MTSATPDGQSPGSRRRTPRVDRVRDPGLGGRQDALSEPDMVGHADSSGEDHVVLDHAAPGNADLRREQDTAANRHAVADLHEVVDLRAGTNTGLADRGAIDRGVGADLDIVLDDDLRPLRNLQMRAVRLPGEPEPSLPSTAPSCTITRWPTTTRSRMRPGADDAIVANPRPGTNRHAGIDDGPRADRRTRTDRHERPDRDVGTDRRVGSHRAGAINAFRRRRRVGEQPDRLRKGEVRLRGNQQRRASRPRLVDRNLFGDEDGRGPRVRELRAVLLWAMKVTSPGSARSMLATRLISASPSPSRRQFNRSASAFSFKSD